MTTSPSGARRRFSRPAGRPTAIGSRAAQAPASPAATPPTDPGLRLLVVEGCLDEEAGRRLTQEVSSAVTARAAGVEIDLRAIDGFDRHGAHAVGVCMARARELDHGVTVLVNTPTSRAAFLACLADV